MKLLICNAGSTSLKFKLFEMPDEKVLARCSIERVGAPEGGRLKYENYRKGAFADDNAYVTTYEDGIRLALKLLCENELGVLQSVSDIEAVGFKTVLSKGYYGTHLLTDDVLRGMEDYLCIAPAHNRHYLSAIRTFASVLPGTPLVGAFETAFHQSIEPKAYIYPVPYEWYERYGLRRLGYHGASHSYIADCLTQMLGKSYKAVSCHLGGSSSLCAIVDGRSVDTSFGMSLQAGLPQSDRCGDIDPFAVQFMEHCSGLEREEIWESLKSKSGLLGISGVSNDMRDIELKANENPRARLAIDVYCHELIRYIGGYAALMNGLDCIAFTGGIGENCKHVRESVLNAFEFMGVEPCEPYGDPLMLTSPGSKLKVCVIPANEELGVCRRVYNLLQNR